MITFGIAPSTGMGGTGSGAFKLLCAVVLQVFHATEVAAATSAYTEKCPADCQLESFFTDGRPVVGRHQGLAPECYKDVEDGGCCTADGEYSLDSSCSMCHTLPLGGPERIVCQDCYQPTSPCKHVNYVLKVEPTCEETGCRGGCLRNDGVCDNLMNETTCREQGGGAAAVFCQSCPFETWQHCMWTSACFGQCHWGCCSTEFGTIEDYDYCPSEPYERRTEGRRCGYCAAVPEFCHGCWKQSVCSHEYDPARPGPALEDIGKMKEVPSKTPTSEPTPAPSTVSPTIAIAAPADENDEASSTSKRAPVGRLTTATTAIASVLGLGGLGCVLMIQ